MRRAIDLAIKAVVAFVSVVFVECFCWRLRRKARSARPASLPPARLRMRTGIGRARATIAIEGTLDEFTARLLACSVAQFPGAAAIVLDLSSAGPIRGKALAVVVRVFAAGRQVRVRGFGDGHEGLFALSSRAERSQPAPVLSLAAHRALHRSSELDLPAGYANAAA